MRRNSCDSRRAKMRDARNGAQKQKAWDEKTGRAKRPVVYRKTA
jgi:hypothetical protein